MRCRHKIITITILCLLLAAAGALSLMPNDAMAATQPQQIPTVVITPIAPPVSESPPAPVVPATVTPVLPTNTPVTETSAPTVATTEFRLDSIGDPYAPELGNSGYDVEHYLIQVEASVDSLSLNARAVIQAITTIDNLDAIYLDFDGFLITRLKLNDASARYKRLPDKLVIYPKVPLTLGQPFTLEISYQGTPRQMVSVYAPDDKPVGLRLTAGKNLYVLAEPDGAHHWFPCNDHPRDKARYRIELKVPRGLTGVANGNLIEHQAGVPAISLEGKQGDLFVWEQNHPMATYLATIVVGEYDLIETVTPGGVQLRSYIFPENKAAFLKMENKLIEMTDWMVSLVGPYPFDTFGFVTVLGLDYCMETQSTVMMDTERMTELCMVHELAHMWFGDLVSLDSWGEIWRKEGLATYFDTLWKYRQNPTAFRSKMNTWMAEKDKSGEALNNLPKEMLYSWDSYNKGALVVYDLRQTVGDEAFFAGLKAYLGKYADSHASDAQFIAEMEAASGMELDVFFARWFAKGE